MTIFSKILSKLLYFFVFVFCINTTKATKLDIANGGQKISIPQAQVVLRTSVKQSIKGIFYIAIDFKVPFGSHITSPEGIGKTVAPSIRLTNCKILDMEWEKPVPILNRDGSASGYTGYYKDFTVLLKVSVTDITQPVYYDIFYVLCSKNCTPCQVKGTLQYNGKLIPQTTTVEKTKVDIKNKPNIDIKTDKQKIKTAQTSISTRVLHSILIGLLGGLILNVMPCVFPVISIKLLSVARSAGQLPVLIRKQCFAYSAGTVLMFFLLGLLLCLIRQKIPSTGWGFYMQIPQFNYSLLILFFLCALHFLDIFKFYIPLPQTRRLQNKEYGLSVKSFFNGMFGAVTSAVCAGPFLGLSIGSALLSGSLTDAIILFVSIGIGLALPFIFIAIFPKYVSYFPKLSEKALRTFSLILGILMLLSCTWVISILIPQLSNPNKVMWTMMTLVIGAFLLYSIQNISTNKIVRMILSISTFAVVASGYITVNTRTQSNKITWHQYAGALPEKRPMFLNFSASWCLNCQFNSRVFNDAEIIKLFNKKNIYAIKCDWTNRSEEVSELLAKFGSVSVPFYVYYPKDGKPIILPTMLTKSNVITVIDKEVKNA